MGIYSTLDITRPDALREILDNLERCSDDELGAVLFAMFGNKTLYNFTVIEDYSKSDWQFKYNEIGLDSYGLIEKGKEND